MSRKMFKTLALVGLVVGIGKALRLGACKKAHGPWMKKGGPGGKGHPWPHFRHWEKPFGPTDEPAEPEAPVA